jgi:L-aspartate oxidase
VPGLFAAGEAACSGVHGANRLASNSLLEGLVFGARAGRAMQACARPERCGVRTEAHTKHDSDWQQVRARLQQVMWQTAAVVRSGTSLQAADDAIETQLESMPHPGSSRSAWETLNLHQTALLLVRCALAREESRGAHYRTDFPEKDERFRRHSIAKISGDNVAVSLQS